MVKLSQLLSENHTVFIYGQEKYQLNRENTNIMIKDDKDLKENQENIQYCRNLMECLNSSNIIISGMPVSRDGVTINAQYSENEIKLEDVYTNIDYKTFIAGGIPVQFYENKTIKNIDLLQLEELTILNAIPTVEGTIKIAIEETEITIHESNIMILGYGRIGKILCKDFKNLGAKVYCVARKESDFAWIREEGCVPIGYNEIQKIGKVIDIIINTVPSLVVEEKVVKNLKKSCVIIDIASNPGGVDKNIAKRYKIKVISALGIPGKIAPLTAAKYIKERIEDLLGDIS